MSAIHVFEEGPADHEVWLDVTVGDEHSGLCIGVGPSTNAALIDALDDLEAAAASIRARLRDLDYVVPA